MKRLKIYFMHSANIDYNNLLYRDILSSSVCLNHELMLPQSKNYQTKYVKDLINDADIIVAVVSKPHFGLSLELKWGLKSGKLVKYISLDNEINKKYKRMIPEIETVTPDKTFISIVERFITQYLEDEESKNKPLILGNL